jgi:hypothetical protein
MRNNVDLVGSAPVGTLLQAPGKVLPIRPLRGQPRKSLPAEEEWVRLNRIAKTQPFCRIHRVKKYDSF